MVNSSAALIASAERLGDGVNPQPFSTYFAPPFQETTRRPTQAGLQVPAKIRIRVSKLIAFMRGCFETPIIDTKFPLPF
jgi:hypothetical protein